MSNMYSLARALLFPLHAVHDPDGCPCASRAWGRSSRRGGGRHRPLILFAPLHTSTCFTPCSLSPHRSPPYSHPTACLPQPTYPSVACLQAACLPADRLPTPQPTILPRPASPPAVRLPTSQPTILPRPASPLPNASPPRSPSPHFPISSKQDACWVRLPGAISICSESL